MPLRSKWSLPREGFTIDTLGRLLKRTALNPALTLPLILLARYTKKGQGLASLHPRVLKHLRTLLYLGLADRISGWLDGAVANNWTNDVYDWSKELVVVTGGADGIGKAIVQMLGEKGIKTAVLDIQPLTYEAPPSAHYYPCDLASPASIATAVAAIRATFSHPPTILINNAGVCFGADILATTPAHLGTTFAVNTLAHFRLAQALLPSMVAANHGMVVTVASQAAYVAAPYMADYAASKAAALAFHEALAAELPTVHRAPKVRTLAVCQNYTRTALFAGFKEGDGVLNYTLEPETVAEEVVRAVLRGRSGLVVLPGAGWWISARVRGWPLWMQCALRKRCVGLMEGWRGRVVAQGEEGKEEEEGERE